MSMHSSETRGPAPSILRRALGLLVLLFLALAPAAAAPAELLVDDLRAGVGQPVSGGFTLVRGDEMPREGDVVLTWRTTFGVPLDAPALVPASKDVQSGASVISREDGTCEFTLRGPATAFFSDKEKEAKLKVATVSFTPSAGIVTRRAVGIVNARFEAGDAAFPVDGVEGSIAVALVTNVTSLFTLLCGTVAGIFMLSRVKAFEGFFKYFPPLIWMYFVPMFYTTFGITPDTSALYSPFMSRTLLPATLVLLLIGSDVRAIAQLGFKALAIMLIGTAGIVAGALVSFAIFHGALPEQAWKGIAALSGSWIGGSPNMTAVIESLKAPPSLIGPLVIVDTVCAYTWLGFLIAGSQFQKRIDAFNRADSRVIDEIAVRLKAEEAANSRMPKTADVAIMLAVAFVVSQVCLWLGKPVFAFFDVTLGMKKMGEVLNAFGWGILLITAAGLFLSTTRIRLLEYCGASGLGNVGLFLLLTTYGAQANLRAIMEVPVFFGVGIVWISVHVVVLLVGVRLMRVPIFLGATASMANIGGTASAPVVAASYNPAMAPVGLLMAILGGILGTPVALLVVGTACKAISGE